MNEVEAQAQFELFLSGTHFRRSCSIRPYDALALVVGFSKLAIVRLRKQDTNQRREQQAILETYMHALGMD